MINQAMTPQLCNIFFVAKNNSRNHSDWSLSQVSKSRYCDNLNLKLLIKSKVRELLYINLLMLNATMNIWIL